MRKPIAAIVVLLASASAIVAVSAPASASQSDCAPLGQRTGTTAWVYESTPGGSGGCTYVYVKAHVLSTTSGLSYWTPYKRGENSAVIYDYYIYGEQHYGVWLG